MKMTRFRIILLSILIPLFIITAVFFCVYNSPQNQITRKIKAIISAQEVLKQDLEKLTMEDMERFNFELNQLKNLMNKKEFSIKNIDIKEILKNDSKMLGNLELFKDKVRLCRDQIEALTLEEEKYTQKYESLINKLNCSINMLAYFSANYQQALQMDQTIMEDFEKFALSENQIYILKPLERYYKQAKVFKNMFISNLDASVAAFYAIIGKKTLAETKPQDKDVDMVINSLAANNYAIISKIKENLDNDSADEVVILSKLNNEAIIEIYDFKNNSYEKIFEKNMGKNNSKNLFIRYYSLIPEVVVFPNGPVFKYNGKEYEMSLY